MTEATHFEHDALLYDTEAAFVGALVPWLKEALAEGQAAVAATTPAHIELLRDGLGSDAGSVAFIDQDEWYIQPAKTIANWNQRLTEFSEKGFEYTRVIGEVNFGVAEATQTSWTRYESTLNAVFQDSPTWIVCPYDMRRLPELLLEEASRTHPTVWNANRQKSDRYVEPASFLTSIPESMPAVAGEPLVELEVGGSLLEVRTRVHQAGIAARLRSERIDDLLIALNEVVANSITHGRDPVAVRVWVTADGAVCEVSDHGEGVSDPLAGYLLPGSETTGGRGLWMARQLSDSIAFTTEGRGTTVRFTINS